MNEIGIPLLKKELSKIDIPDVSDKADILIGKVKYKLKKFSKDLQNRMGGGGGGGGGDYED